MTLIYSGFHARKIKVSSFSSTQQQKQVAATLTVKGGIAVAACRTSFASAGYSPCIAVGREISPPGIVISRGGNWSARNA